MALPQPRLPFTAEDYLQWEERQTLKHEYVNGEVFAMSGAEDRHVTIQGNLYTALRQHLRGGPCRVYVSDVKLHVAAANAYYYPDVFVTCGARDAASRLVKTEARLIIEVLSPSTAAYDRGGKFASYRLLPTLQEYAVVDIDARSIDLFRKAAGGLWVLHPGFGQDTVRFESVGLSLPLSECFADLEGDPPSAPTPESAHPNETSE